MKHFIPANKLPSPGAAIQELGGVKHRTTVGWEMRRSVPALVRNSIAREKAERVAKGYPVFE